jgi:RimJ/RimL family protein N-acetyltransferase
MITQAPELDTERLRLTAHRTADFEAALELWSSVEVTRFITGRPSTGEEVWSRLLRYGGLWPLLGFGYWAVRDKRTGAFLGEVGFADFRREMQPASRAPEMGWALRREFWGKGYAREAIGAALHWADGSLRNQDIVCLVSPENARSIRMAESHGFAFELEATYRGGTTRVFRRRAQAL